MPFTYLLLSVVTQEEAVAVNIFSQFIGFLQSAFSFEATPVARKTPDGQTPSNVTPRPVAAAPLQARPVWRSNYKACLPLDFKEPARASRKGRMQASNARDEARASDAQDTSGPGGGRDW